MISYTEYVQNIKEKNLKRIKESLKKILRNKFTFNEKDEISEWNLYKYKIIKL
nr:MAG TPA: hypothetical protein [Caudoviricetes sp.]